MFVQKEFYKSLLARHYPVLAGGVGGQSKLDRRSANPSSSLKNICMELRKCCNHPYLFEGADPKCVLTGLHCASVCMRYLLVCFWF